MSPDSLATWRISTGRSGSAGASERSDESGDLPDARPRSIPKFGFDRHHPPTSEHTLRSYEKQPCIILEFGFVCRFSMMPTPPRGPSYHHHRIAIEPGERVGRTPPSTLCNTMSTSVGSCLGNPGSLTCAIAHLRLPGIIAPLM